MKTLLGLFTCPATPTRHAWWALPLRLIVGYGFMEHGYAKLARGPAAFTGILHAVTPAGAHFGQPGYETDLLYLSCLAALVLGGSGPFTLASILTSDHPPNESQERR